MPIIKLGTQAAKILYKDEYYLLPENGYYDVNAEIAKLISDKISDIKMLTAKDVSDYNAKLIADAEAKKIKVIKPEPGKKSKAEEKKVVKKKK